MAPSANPIGVFDSGVGGLTVVAALERRLPKESILYLGDTARLPYGSKSATTVRRYTRRNLEFLRKRGVKAAVIACNTASALALSDLESPMPFFGVIEPGAAEAVRSTRGKIGVIATASTIGSDAYARAIHALDSEVEVSSTACPLLVPLVEEGWHDDPVTAEIARRYLEPLLAKGIDTLVLGCTHYPLLKTTLRQVVGEEVTMIDSAETVAAKVAAELARLDLLSSGDNPEFHFCLTDVNNRFRHLAETILDCDDLTTEWVDVL